MGSYERQRYSNIYKNYLEMKTLGKSYLNFKRLFCIIVFIFYLDLDIPKPDFLEEYELSQTSKNKKQGRKKKLGKSSKIASVSCFL